MRSRTMLETVSKQLSPALTYSLFYLFGSLVKLPRKLLVGVNYRKNVLN